MQINYKGKKYKIIKNLNDNNRTNSYINHSKKIIYIRRNFDLLHEILHLIFFELDMNKEIEEFITTFISENIEKMILENLNLVQIYNLGVF